MTEHLSRKELKQDKIHDALEHGAEAVYSHSQLAAVLVAIAIAAVLVYGGNGAGHVELRTQQGFVSDFVSPIPSRRPLIGVYVKRA